MPIGTVTGQPSQHFAMPRSYLWGISIKSGAAVPVWSDNQMLLWDFTFTTFYWGLIFKPEFWAWSSNRWTVDFVLHDAWYGNTNPALGSPLPVYVSYFQNQQPEGAVLEVAAFGLGDHIYPHALPSTTDPYWAYGTDN
jgi:hypothetical protein